MLAVCLIQNGGKSRLWSPIGARFLYRRMWVKKKKISKKSAGHFSGLRKTIRIVFFGRKNNWHKKLTKKPCAGYFSYQKKQHGLFFVAVQTFSKKIFACVLKSTKMGDLINAIGLMIKGTFFFLLLNICLGILFWVILRIVILK